MRTWSPFNCSECLNYRIVPSLLDLTGMKRVKRGKKPQFLHYQLLQGCTRLKYLSDAETETHPDYIVIPLTHLISVCKCFTHTPFPPSHIYSMFVIGMGAKKRFLT